LDIVFISDGTTDWSYDILMENRKIKHLYQPIRKGKSAAINRAMQHIKSEIVVFSDANSILNKNSINNIINHFSDPKVGCVAGEKRILSNKNSSGASEGEGFYWRYESTLKKWDSELNTTIGAAGELYAIRNELFTSLSEDTILDDFTISMNIVKQGYKIIYEPNAYAYETGSVNTKEEMKRKVRIAAGGIQSIIRLKSLLNIFKYKTITLQYVGHRVVRWTFAPICLFLLLPLNLILSLESNLYLILFAFQIAFYAAAIVGWLLEKKESNIRIFNIPYFFFMMNYSAIIGLIRFLSSDQSVLWQKSERARII